MEFWEFLDRVKTDINPFMEPCDLEVSVSDAIRLVVTAPHGQKARGTYKGGKPLLDLALKLKRRALAAEQRDLDAIPVKDLRRQRKVVQREAYRLTTMIRSAAQRTR